jgi:precorrin-2/cobalt-factor-2 C20-methyltransferase
VVELVCPPFRDRAALLARWSELAGQVAARLGAGGDAAFLTEGDPSLYSTFQYLRLALARDHPAVRIEVVPGVTSACAAAAAAGVPLAMWDECVALLPGTAEEGLLRAALRDFHTVALLKPRAAIPLLAQTASAGAREVTVVQRVGRPEQAIMHGEAAAARAVEDYFSLVLVRAKRAAGEGA